MKCKAKCSLIVQLEEYFAAKICSCRKLFMYFWYCVMLSGTGIHQLGLFALQSAEEFLCQEKQEFGNLVKLLGRHFSNGNCVIFLNLLKFRFIK